ncbi:MAG: radical SAM-associated putative lipoprotein [Bacteroidales bacterium]
MNFFLKKNILAVVFTVLTVFSLTGCDVFDDENTHGGDPITYYADYIIKGTVNTTLKEPIKDIRVIISELYTNTLTGADILINPDTLYTNSVGEYSFTRKGFTNAFRVLVVDIDGMLNKGDFSSDSLDVSTFVFADGDSASYLGTATADGRDFILKEKQ